MLQKYYGNIALHSQYKRRSKHVFIGSEGLENKYNIHMCINFKVLLTITENLVLYPNITVAVHDHWIGGVSLWSAELRTRNLPGYLLHTDQIQTNNDPELFSVLEAWVIWSWRDCWVSPVTSVAGPNLTEQTHLMSKCQSWVMEDCKSHTGLWTLKLKDTSLLLLLG